jgi:hypothetical protein
MSEQSEERAHQEHLWRTGVIAALLIFIGAAVLVLAVTHEAPDLRARLEGALALLFPALLDSLRVAKKQHKALVAVPFDEEDTNPTVASPSASSLLEEYAKAKSHRYPVDDS